jgi:hypothetical protein
VTECDEKPGRLGDICRGEVLTVNICNSYRKKWGLEPLPERPAVKRNAKPARKDQKIRGLGDVVAAITKATGIDRLVKAVTGKKGCGCSKRQSALNKLFPFGKQA